jgi:HipA-like C-terminal domain
MADKFPIIEVPFDAAESLEEIGSKEKFWFLNSEQRRCLFKKARPNTGEDWAEKIVSSLSKLLGLPHADYDLAICNNENGVISPSFLPQGGSLILGNEILSPIVQDYPKTEKYKVFQHSIDNIFKALTQNSLNPPINWTPPNGITTAAETFVGYLLLDAWIGNSDRHHENWAFIAKDNQTYLAPTYDHASSLGRELLDEKRLLKLNNKSVTGYVEKCTSAIYAGVGEAKLIKTFDVFCQVQQRYAGAARIWLDNLAKVSNDDIVELSECVPLVRISKPATEFAQKILELNQIRLLQQRNTTV